MDVIVAGIVWICLYIVGFSTLASSIWFLICRRALRRAACWQYLGNVVGWIKGISYAISTLLVAASNQNLNIWTDPPELIKLATLGLQSVSWLTLGFLLISFYLSWIESLVRYNRKDWQTIHIILDAIHALVFKDKENPNSPIHQTTLFKKVSWSVIDFDAQKSFTHHVVAFERSGESTQSLKSKFPVPRDYRKAEGVAGTAYACWGELPVHGLAVPSIDELKRDDTDAKNKLSDYAKQTLVSDKLVRKWIKNGKELSLSFHAIPIMVNGKKWGILLFDSKESNPINVLKNKAKYNLLFKCLVECLGAIENE